MLAFTNLAFAAPSSIPSSDTWSDFEAFSQKPHPTADSIDNSAIANHPLNKAFPPPDQSLVYSKSKVSDQSIKPVTLIDKNTPVTNKPEDAPLETILGDNLNLKAATTSRVKEFKNRKVYDYREKIPSPFFQKERYAKPNNHLPGVTYQGDFTRLLFSAADKEDIGAISSLLERGADINGKLRGPGITPLMVATKNRSGNIVRYLVLRGADVNLADNTGSTALHIAARNQDYPVIMFLLDNGANMDKIDYSGKKPLDYLPENQRVSIIISRLTTQAEFDKALLDFAASGSYIGVSLAIRKGARIDAQNNNGDTALLLAACSGSKELVALILSHCANPLIVNKNCMTAIDCATRCMNADLVLLIDTYTIKYELEHGVSRPKKSTHKHVHHHTLHNTRSHTTIKNIRNKSPQKPHHKMHRGLHLYNTPTTLDKPHMCKDQSSHQICGEMVSPQNNETTSFFGRIKNSISNAFSKSSTEGSCSEVIEVESDITQTSINEKPLPKLDTDVAPDAPVSAPLAPLIILPKEIAD